MAVLDGGRLGKLAVVKLNGMFYRNPNRATVDAETLSVLCICELADGPRARFCLEPLGKDAESDAP